MTGRIYIGISEKPGSSIERGRMVGDLNTPNGTKFCKEGT